MHPYEFTVSLRIYHPNIDPDSITSKLGKTPKFAWRAGEPAITPKGQELEGSRKTSYRCAELSGGEPLYSGDIEIERFVLDSLSELSEFENFFSEILTSGGKVECFVGLFGDRNLGILLDSNLIAELSELGVELALDYYPPQSDGT